MNTITYLQINIIPVIALIILRINAKQTLSYSWRNRALRFIMILLTVAISMDMLAYVLDGQVFPGAAVLLWGLNMLYLGLLGFILFLWFLYVYDILTDGNGQRGKSVILPVIPFAVLLVLLVTSPWTHLIFYIDEQNHYVRGAGYVLHMIIWMGYVVCASLQSLWHARRACTEERRMECRWLAYCVFFPLTAGALQIFEKGIDLFLPSISAFLLMLYVNVQQKKITRDALTGLNNRRRLEEYMKELDSRKLESAPYYMIMIDVDQFKKINDTCGHVIGDEVLGLVAEQMKQVFGYSRSFLSRYGGDEFVIIIREKKAEQVENYIHKLKEAVRKMDWGKGKPWEISISVGWAEYHKEGVHSMSELAVIADERMYEQKSRNKQ